MSQTKSIASESAPRVASPSSPYAARPWLKHYDYWVPARMTYPGKPLYEILATTAVETPDAQATAFLGAALTFREIKRRTDRLAQALVTLGIAKGDRVGIMLPNCPQYILATFATLRLGAIVVNINPIYTARELLNVATDSGIKILITLDKLAPLALDVRSKSAFTRVIVTSLSEYSAEQAGPPRIPDTLSLTDLTNTEYSDDLPLVQINPDDLAVLQYTGGTTGTPKGAMLTHGNIFANVVQTETWQYRTYERGVGRYLLVIPYFHIYAFTVGMMCGIWVGGLQILIPKYDVEQVLTAIRDFTPTYFPGVPTIFVSLLAHPKVKDYGLDQIKTINSGGAPCPVEVMEEFERRIGRPLTQGYGLSETSPVTHSTPQLAKRKMPTIGLALPDTDFKIVDVETGTQGNASRRIGRAVHLWSASDEGLLEQAGRIRRRPPAARRRSHLVPHRRRCDDGRRRLHVDRAAQEGHDHRRWIQRVSVRGRRGALHTSRGANGCGYRRAGRLSR